MYSGLPPIQTAIVLSPPSLKGPPGGGHGINRKAAVIAMLITLCVLSSGLCAYHIDFKPY